MQFVWRSRRLGVTKKVRDHYTHVNCTSCSCDNFEPQRNDGRVWCKKRGVLTQKKRLRFKCHNSAGCLKNERFEFDKLCRNHQSKFTNQSELIRRRLKFHPTINQRADNSKQGQTEHNPNNVSKPIQNVTMTTHRELSHFVKSTIESSQ